MLTNDAKYKMYVNEDLLKFKKIRSRTKLRTYHKEYI